MPKKRVMTLREAAAKAGRAKVPKGFSMMDPARRSEIAKAAAIKRWADARAKAVKEVVDELGPLAGILADESL